eukprot:SAG31_NODE_790_length_12082_cov_8.754319_7_plen_46_part_00
MSRADAMRMAYGHAMIIIMISPTITVPTYRYSHRTEVHVRYRDDA